MPKQSVNQVTGKNRWETLHCWRILSLNSWADSLIQFIPIFMSAEVKEAPSTQLSSDMFDYSVNREPDANYALIQEALNTFEAYCGENLPALDLSITGKLERDGVKFGIGSSGSVVGIESQGLGSGSAERLVRRHSL